MEWMKSVCGRLESRYRYSIEIVYNNFPFINLSSGVSENINKLSKQILNIREEKNLSLEKLYDPLLMPEELRKKHKELDSLVLKLYGLEHNCDGNTMMKTLFNLYEKKLKTLQ